MPVRQFDNAALKEKDDMPKVAIYRFKSYDIAKDEIKTSRRWATKAAIEEVGGQPLPETAVEVDPSILGSEVVGMTERDWWPPQGH